MPEYEQLELPFDPPLDTIPEKAPVPVFPPTLEQRVSALEARVHVLENSKPGRRGTPIKVKEKGVCGLDPECDSATCEKASVYRFQKGCRGDACEKAYREYYSEYRKTRRGTENAELAD